MNILFDTIIIYDFAVWIVRLLLLHHSDISLVSQLESVLHKYPNLCQFFLSLTTATTTTTRIVLKNGALAFELRRECKQENIKRVRNYSENRGFGRRDIDRQTSGYFI